MSGNLFSVPEDYLSIASVAVQSALNADETSGSVDKPDKDILSMRSLHASIEQEGILTPLLVRRARRTTQTVLLTAPSAEQTGKQTGEQTIGIIDEKQVYEILSGYRRKRVCEVLSKTNPAFSFVPVIVIKPCGDDTAISIITSSNVQRREVSLLETIKSCGQMYRVSGIGGRRMKKAQLPQMLSPRFSD